jgi:hypothetical protein
VGPWKGNSFPSASRLIDRIHRPKVIRKDETVIFFPTASYQEQRYSNSSGPSSPSLSSWVVPIHGWIFDDERRGLRRRAFVALLRKAFDYQSAKRKSKVLPIMNHGNNNSNTTLKLLEEEESLLRLAAQDYEIQKQTSKEILSRRILPFVVDNHRRRKITIRVGDHIERELPERSRKNGHFTALLRFTTDEMEAIIQRDDGGNDASHMRFHAVTGVDGDTREFVGKSLLVPPTPGHFSVISDIDDTIKITNVLQKQTLIRRTFLEEFEAVPGMSQLYQNWKEQHNAVFHFVSSSPWQLYQELAVFMEREGFPEASFHLKSIRLKDRSILSLFADPMISKITRISSIIDNYPMRKFVLVGDTGERDPEVYGELCRRYPGQIYRVFLRDVISEQIKHNEQQQHALPVNGMAKSKKIKKKAYLYEKDRYEKAFLGTNCSWSLFMDPSTIQL